MNWAGYSNLAIVTSWVLFLVAMVLHGLEWAFAGRIRAGGAQRTKAREYATVGVGNTGDDSSDTEFSSAAASESSTPSARSERFGRMGLAMTVLAFALTLLGLVARGIAAGRAPWGNMYEFMLTAMVFIVGAYLVLAIRYGQRWMGLFVTLLAALGNGLAVTVFYVGVAPLVPALHSVWFIIHIVIASIAGAAFNIGGIASIMYLIRGSKRGQNWFPMLPDQKKLDRLAYGAHAFAFPLWTFAVAAGAVWAQYAWGRPWGWDPKETWALITWAIYAGYLHARATAGWKGKRAAIIAVIGMASFWFNFIGVNLVFSGLHSYAGI